MSELGEAARGCNLSARRILEMQPRSRRLQWSQLRLSDDRRAGLSRPQARRACLCHNWLSTLSEPCRPFPLLSRFMSSTCRFQQARCYPNATLRPAAVISLLPRSGQCPGPSPTGGHSQIMSAISFSAALRHRHPTTKQVGRLVYIGKHRRATPSSFIREAWVSSWGWYRYSSNYNLAEETRSKPLQALHNALCLADGFSWLCNPPESCMDIVQYCSKHI
jgi:hypothetical protein